MRTSIAVGIVLSLGYVSGCEHRESGQKSEPVTTTTSAEDQRAHSVGQAPAANEAVREPNPANVPTTAQAQTQSPTSGTPQGSTPNMNPTPGQNPAAAPVTITGEAAADTAARQPTAKAVQPSAETGREAEGKLKTVKGIDLEGSAKLEELSNGVRVTVNVKDAPPGKRGVHIHEKGDCSNIAGESMGGEFAPTGHQHGLPGAPEHQLGDLGNIEIAQDGSGTLDITVPGANLKKDDRLSLLGKALVIHQGEDRGVGKFGGAGTPIACAVIKTD